MSTCRWDAEYETYMLDSGVPCKVDEYGDPTRHCTARRTCSQHVGWGELTCARCLGRVRRDIREIVDLVGLMLPEAMDLGTVENEAANLAGAAGDPVVLSWRRIDAARMSDSLIGDGIEELHDPTAVLGNWQHALSEDYGIDLPDRVTLATAAKFLDLNLGRVAQDERQDFPLLRREIAKCRSHLEAVLRNSSRPEKGAPCPVCVQSGKVDPAKARLTRWYPHWCDDEDCTKIHDDTDASDWWVCPRDRTHKWTHEDYVRWIEERKAVGA